VASPTAVPVAAATPTQPAAPVVEAWRLLSNSGELAFNQGQLEALDIPENVATTWPAALVALDGAQDVLVEAISTQDGPSILASVETVRAQVEATRAVVNTAQ